MSLYQQIKKDFPILFQQVNEEPLIYLDNAATAQKPVQVLEAVEQYYRQDNANVHRGVHTLAERATTAYEAARQKVRHFLQAASEKEIVFTSGTTQAINMVAYGYGDAAVSEGDEIYLTPMEHHSNLIPWQQLAKRKKARLIYLPLNEDGEVDLEQARQLIGPKGKILAVAHASNVLGTVNPVRELADLIHAAGGIIVVDGAQAAPHFAVDVRQLDCDFYAFSGHKLMAPTGTGALYGKRSRLEEMEPVFFGGEMIDFVYDYDSTWKELPWKLEAGTPNIAGAIGLGAAVDYLQAIGMAAVERHEKELTAFLLPRLQQMDGIEVYGTSDPLKHTSVLTFNLAGIHPHDVATAFDMEGIAIRAGHHCAQPLMRYLNVPATARASFYLYNSLEDARQFLVSLERVKEFFNHGVI